jgi:hypothetical protein
MKKKIFYGLLYVVLTVMLIFAASHYLALNIHAGAGDLCFCECEDDAFDGCDYACRYHDGCLGALWVDGTCDSSATTCNNKYELLCEDRFKRIFVCSEICGECDKSFWQ